MRKVICLFVLLTSIQFLPVFLGLKTALSTSLARAAAVAIEILSPKDKLLTREDRSTVSGKAKGLKEVMVNGEVIDVEADGTFSAGLVLHPGKNLVEASAYDEAGEKVSAERRILRIVSYPDIEALFKGKPYWARKEVIYLSSLQVIEGYPDGTFLPKNFISKGELATWLARAKNLKKEELTEDPFFDVPKEHWRAPFIKSVTEAGFMEGEKTFGVDDSIQRSKVADVICRAEDIERPTAITAHFADVSADLPEAPSIYGVFRNGLMIGVSKKKPFYFQPQRDMTRAEAATLLSRIPEVKEMSATLFDFGKGYDEKAYCKVNAAPVVVDTAAKPESILADEEHVLTLTATVTDKQGLSDITRLIVNLSSIGGPPDALMEDTGEKGDERAGDGIYTLQTVVAKTTSSGSKTLKVTAIDKSGWTGQRRIIVFVTK